MIDDFLGWILFSIIIQMMNAKGDATATSVLMILGFVAFMLTIGKWLVDKILGFAVKYLTVPSGVLTAAVCLCILGAVLRNI